MATITKRDLARISRNPDPDFYDLGGDAQALGPQMEKAGITTRLRKAAFLANVCQETDYLKTLEEYGSRAYFESFLGDQWRYHGRGYLMNTWRDAYARLSNVLGVDLIANPDLLASNKTLAARAATWFWTAFDLNEVADDRRFVAVASQINRGELVPRGPINGFDIRLGLYRRALDALDPDYRFELWPEGFTPLAPTAGNYQQRHPTRYFWEVPVEGMVRRLYRVFGRDRISINTYVEHPEDWGWDTTSFDVWGPGGRNDPIGFELGQAVVDFVVNDPFPPWIEWYIWRRTMRTRTAGYAPEPFGVDPFSFHDDHPHFSFTGPRRRLF